MHVLLADYVGQFFGNGRLAIVLWLRGRCVYDGTRDICIVRTCKRVAKTKASGKPVLQPGLDDNTSSILQVCDMNFSEAVVVRKDSLTDGILPWKYYNIS